MARQGPGPTAAQARGGATDHSHGEREPGLGYDRIAGAMANFGYVISDQTVGNVLRRNGLSPEPERKRTTPLSVFIRIHLALLVGTDFFTAEVLTLRGLVIYYLFIHLESRRVDSAGITVHRMGVG
jgi:putative transposase